MKNYLPSKKFVLHIGIFILLISGIFLISFIGSKKENFLAKNNTNGLEIEHQTVSDLVKKDTDGDNIQDWEEALWGTDPKNPKTFDNIKDDIYIANKKKALNIDLTQKEDDLTETDKFARDFFAAFTAMKVSGEVEAEKINNFSSALGQKIANPELIDMYSLKEIKTEKDNSILGQKKYYIIVQKIFNKYEAIGLGDELSIVADQLTAEPEYNLSTEENKQLLIVAEAYKNFAKDIMQVAVPAGLIQYHLTIANSANNTGISIANMTKVTADPVVGLSGLSQYEKYSESLIKAASDLEKVLFK